MAENYLKLIQDGVTSYVPDNKQNRDFWARQNARLGKGRSAANELVTILKATPDEVEFMTKPVAESAAFLQKQSNPESATAEQLAKMQAMIESQQALINKFLLGSIPSDIGVPVPGPTPGVTDASDLLNADKPKGKPGPKLKTETDGKDETKVSTEA